TSRRAAGLEAIEAAGIEAAAADPERPGTLLDLVGDVAVLHYLLGSAAGAPEDLEAIHGPRLESLLEKLVDTPVRGFAYEATGSVDQSLLEAGAELVRAAGATWRIPVAVLSQAAGDHRRWAEETAELTTRLLGGREGGGG
ncbi:MAG: hypothetical protein ACM3NV_07810, partial [Syntrophothermus sp.]